MPTYAPTDWRQHLGLIPGVEAESIPAPLPDPMASFQLPAEGNLRPNQLADAIGFMYGLRQQQEAARQAAIRYAGQQKFQRLRAQAMAGQVGEEEATKTALMGSADLLLYGKPESLPGMYRSLKTYGKPYAAPVPVTDPSSGEVLGHWVTDATGRQHWLGRNRQADIVQKTQLQDLEAKLTRKLTEHGKLLEDVRKGNADPVAAQRQASQLLAEIKGLENERVAVSRGMPPSLNVDNQGVPTPETLGLTPAPAQSAPSAPPARTAPRSKGRLSKDQARAYFKRANGNQAKAEELARAEGWEF